MGKEESTPGTEVVEEEEFLFLQKNQFLSCFWFRKPHLANLTVISLGSFRKESFVLRKLLLIWERDTVDTLQGVIFGVTKEVRSGVLI